MKFYGLFLSCVVHGGIAAGIFIWSLSSSGEKKFQIQEAPPCNIPLEVTAVSEISQAPISKPKSTKPVSEKTESDDQEKRVIENLLPEPSSQLQEKSVQEPPKPELKEIPKEKEPLLPPVKPLPPEKQPKVKPKKEKNPRSSITDSISKTLDKIPPLKKKAAKKTLGEEKKKKKSSYSEDFINVLKDVDKTEPDGPSAETPITDPNSTSPYGAAQVGSSMAMSIVDRVRGALERVWRVPLRGENLVIVVEITINPDATIRNVKVAHHQSTIHDPVYQVGVESVLKATDHYRKTALPIPKDYRDEFKNFDFSFSVKK